MVMGDLPVETDMVVVGGGPGGYAAAFRAADSGLDVMLVSDESRLGGVCLLRGCIPSKTLLSLTELVLAARDAESFGVGFGDPEIDIDRLLEWKQDVIEGMARGLQALCKRRGVQVIEARARLTGTDELYLEDSDDHRIKFGHAVLATGSRPTPLPGTEFGGRVMDSRRALELESVPDRLLVVGGGYVGLELGMVYSVLGSEVSLVEMTDRLLPQTDPDLVEPLSARVDDLFQDVQLETRVEAIEETEEGVTVNFSGDGGESERYDAVLIAIGRQPNVEDLGLEDAGVELDDDGYIAVDDERRTSVESIFAIGDVAGGKMLAHEAMREGRVAAEVIAGEPAAFDVRAVPAVVYTDPQIAWCGLTEREAEETNREIEVARFPWRASGRAASIDATDGLTKVIVDPETEQVLGVGIVGPQAEALIAEGVLAVEMGAVAADLALIVHPHPTLTETLGEAAQLLLGGATHFYPRKRD
ncbi:MAG: dihydrolipoyl dehydrogenase [Gemmatimonadetes bacterium]|uniref:Dihydrolipoyl dehydrogenase n=1 Tax=Candidatus Kutchimonas denitrificans TaxID=3056748 RepID=A0AAE4ZAN5_9BACT|nr:dihydrolipoyl dehydrogenase [Gemmatimonadota bacterium]NIR76703.1 dihydrolipoyl dehydrogenase [Candidatus Kutchimonas denitrificans]NIS01190.1 dihydrolipoyl dehydrogenase [Gemmatimonadota bacterium]NIT68229.1 dihydrolipoyl dehydrogenase [Gemmatimonadota bacterium]NIW75447.1 dihydrolipoyl dehydrogenase [Gemmatimonadota bacterium]